MFCVALGCSSLPTSSRPPADAAATDVVTGDAGLQAMDVGDAGAASVDAPALTDVPPADVPAATDVPAVDAPMLSDVPVVDVPVTADVSVPSDVPVAADVPLPVDVPVAVDVPVPVDVPVVPDVPAPTDAPDSGPTVPTLTGGFVGGAVFGSAGAATLRGVFTWHATVQGSSGGVSLEGWLR